MASNRSDDELGQRNKFALVILGGLLLFVAGRFCWGLLQSPPQLTPAPEVFNTVDALFTAVTAQDAKRLADCEQRLKGYQASGKLTSAAWKRLASVIATARQGSWDSAARTLYDFIQGQRGEGIERTTRAARVTGPRKAGKGSQPVSLTSRPH